MKETRTTSPEATTREAQPRQTASAGPRGAAPTRHRRGGEDTRALRGLSTRAHGGTPCHRSGRALQRRSGRTGAGALLLLLVVVAAVLGLVLSQREGARDQVADLGPRTATEHAAPTPSIEGPAAAPRSLSEEANVAAGPIRFDGPGDWTRLPKLFDQTGTLAVDLAVAQGLPFPSAWTLHIEASPLAEGREHAVPRERTFTRGERSVEEIDVPMGAYRVYASAAGLVSAPQEVVLHRIQGYEHLPGVNWVRVGVTLQKTAGVFGAIVGASGAAAPDLAVTLRQVGGAARHTTLTGPNGSYRFADVLPGRWNVLVGDPDRPLLPHVVADVLASDVEVPRFTLPPLLNLELLAIDFLQRPVPHAELSGYCRAEGSSSSFRGRTDAQGRLRVPYLAPGPWRFDGRHEELGLAGRLDLALALEGDGQSGAGADGVQHVTLYLPQP